MQPAVWTVYLVENNLGNLYCGICTNLERRFKEHAANGKLCAKALRGKGPLKLKYACVVGDRSSALKVEYWLKQQPKRFKLALIDGDVLLPQGKNSHSQESLTMIQQSSY